VSAKENHAKRKKLGKAENEGKSFQKAFGPHRRQDSGETGGRRKTQTKKKGKCEGKKPAQFFHEYAIFCPKTILC